MPDDTPSEQSLEERARTIVDEFLVGLAEQKKSVAYNMTPGERIDFAIYPVYAVDGLMGQHATDEREFHYVPEALDVELQRFFLETYMNTLNNTAGVGYFDSPIPRALDAILQSISEIKQVAVVLSTLDNLGYTPVPVDEQGNRLMGVHGRVFQLRWKEYLNSMFTRFENGIFNRTNGVLNGYKEKINTALSRCKERFFDDSFT